jgi:hypothetical protein
MSKWPLLNNYEVEMQKKLLNNYEKKNDDQGKVVTFDNKDER